MLFVAVCNIGWDGFSPQVSYTINLVAIGVVAFGCTVQQASYYGFTGCLPPRYTQAVMAGESTYDYGENINNYPRINVIMNIANSIRKLYEPAYF